VKADAAMQTRRLLFAITVLNLILCVEALGQTANPVLLKIAGEVEKPLSLTAADLAKLPRVSTKAKDHDGKEAVYEGVPLVEVLKLAGVKFGEALRGKNLALFLVVDAADGYRAVYALPELDDSYNDKVFILADKRDGAPLSSQNGPLQIIVPAEKKHARWVRQVTALTIRRAE